MIEVSIPGPVRHSKCVTRDARRGYSVNRLCSSEYLFFFQAEDGIRDYKVTGVQTCALPIFGRAAELLARIDAVLAQARGARAPRLEKPTLRPQRARPMAALALSDTGRRHHEIGRASCRERV